MSAGLIARLRAARRGDAGVTLIELLVGMVLTTIIGAMTLTLFLSINTSSDATVDRTINTASARATIQAWTAYLRVADGTTAGDSSDRIEWLTANDMMFRADLFNRNFADATKDTAPTLVWLRIDAHGSLVEQLFPPSGPSVCRVLVTNASASQLFTPYSDNDEISVQNGLLGTEPAGVSSQAGCLALPALPAHPVTSLQTVTSVIIDFIVRDRQADHPLDFKSKAVLPAVYTGGT